MTQMSTTKQFTDNIHGTILYSGTEGMFVGTPAFNRLHNILQSSLAYLTYPSNKVKRFEHSIGTMKNAGDIFYHSICNTSDEKILNDFFKTMEKEIATWLNKQDSLRFAHPDVFRTQKSEPISNWKIPNATIYNIYTPGNIEKNKNIYIIVFQAIRLCGLLHDIGHLPFSHILENFLKSLYDEIIKKTKKNPREQEFIKAITPYYNTKSIDSKVEIHEGIGIKLFEHILDNITNLKTDIRSEDWLFLDTVCFVAKKILSSDETTGFSIFKDLHLIVSGMLDADRLDYCNRDLSGAGIKYTPTNNKRLLSGYKLIKRHEKMSQKPKRKNQKPTIIEGDRYYFSPSLKNIDEIENLIDLRWKDFSCINFHHRVHKHEILLEEVLKILAKDFFCKKGATTTKPFNSSTTSLPLEIDSIWKLLQALHNKSKIEHLLIQMDDNWLNALLKQCFFEKYGTTYMNDDNSNKSDWNIYHELISAQRHYFSLIKREAEFRRIDASLFELLQNQIVSNGITKAKLSEYIYKDILEKFIDEQYYSFVNAKGFVFNMIIGMLHSDETLLLKVESKLKTRLLCENVNDIIIRKSQFGLGYSFVKEPVYLNSDNNNYYRIEQRSRQLNDLQERQAHLPYFHVYYLPKYDSYNAHYISINTDRIFETVESVLFEEISEDLFKKIKT